MSKDLATRAAGAVAQQENGGKPTVAQLIEQMKPEIGRALPKHMDPDRLARIALTVLRQTPGLARCTPNSFLGALMTCAQLGLEPGPLGEAYLVPFGNEVTFIPGYRGLIKLAWQSGQLESIDAQVVHEADHFDYEYGLHPFLEHKPTMGTPGKAVAAYCVARLQNGGSAFRVMSVAEVEAIRKRSRSSAKGPWVSDWDAMARKTVIRQLIKMLPMSTSMVNLMTADRLDGTVRTEALTAPADEVQAEWVEGEVADDAEPAEDIEQPPVYEGGEF